MSNQLQVKEKVSQVLQEVGIVSSSLELNDDIDLVEFIEDSLIFISMIVQLEEAFSITIPDEYLVMDRFNSLNAFCSSIEDLLVSHENDEES